MPVKRRIPRHRIAYESQHILQLSCGSDFFGDAFGDDREAMREAWQTDPELRAKVYERTRRRWGEGKIPWAEQKFGRYDNAGRLTSGEKQGSS